MALPKSNAPYRHIFWDMGGTIVNTYPQLDAALAGVVRDRGEHHDLDARECVRIGDRPLDAASAHAAGMDAVMLRTPRIPFDNDAQYQVESLAEMLPLLH